MKKLCLILVFLLSSTNSIKASEIKAEPVLVITTLDGRNFDLREKLGKVVIVNFWAHWCSECRREMPILEEMYQKYKSQGLEIIGVSIDPKSKRQKVLEIASSFSYPNSMLIDAKKTNFEEPHNIPVTYIFDRSGKLATKLDGAYEDKFMKQNFENILLPLLRNSAGNHLF